MKKIAISTVTSCALLMAAYNDPGTDYSKAKVQTWMEEDTLRVLEQVNDILDTMSQSKAPEFIGKGTYKALIKQNNDSGDAIEGTGGNTNTEKLSEMTLNVTRADTESDTPMVLNFSLDVDGPNNTPMRILGNIEAYSADTSEYPFGKFLMNLKGVDINTTDGSAGSTTIMTGVLEATKDATTGLGQVFFDSNSSGYIESLLIDVNTTSGEGSGFTRFTNSYSGIPEAYKLAFNRDYYVTEQLNYANMEDNSTTSPVTKDLSSYDYFVFQYGLYDSNGNSVSLNSGFPIKTANDEHGYAGYYGIWMPEGVDVNNSMTVYHETTNTAYTVVAAPGKLIKHTAATITLSELADTNLYYYDNGNNYVITWDTSAQKFKVLGKQDNYGNADTSDADAGKYINGSGGSEANSSLSVYSWSNAWSQALNAPIEIADSTLTNSSTIKYHKQETLTSSFPTTLYNYGYEFLDVNGSGGHRADTNTSIIGLKVDFNVSAGYVLQLNEQNLTLASDANFTNTNYSHWEYGVELGPLLENNTTYGLTDFWDVYDEDTYYTWRTGSNEYDKLTALSSGSSLVAFDAPMVFQYTHSTANDANGDSTYNGKKYSFEYDGFSLNLPWVFDETNYLWKPLFNLKTGTTLTSGSSTYYVKQLERGAKLDTTTTSSGLTLPSTFNEADIAAEYNASKITWSDKPSGSDINVTVIKGQCVFTNCATSAN